jgi:hypothetical protein
MPVDKILISHVVSEVLIICGVTFYFHKKCARLQQQIDELNSKLEKLNANSYMSSLKRQEQFEVQTVQQINKIYSILNNMNNLNNTNNINNIENISTGFKPVYNEPIRENYNSVQQESQVNNQGLQSNKPQPPQNTLLSGLSNGLSMLSSLPISTMFQVVMKDKPHHPDDLFQNMDINKELNKNKIDSVKTNAKGVLNVKLSFGTYKFFEPWKYYRQIPYGEKESNINMECLALEWEISDMKITVGKKIVYDEYKLLYPICSYRFPCLINKHFPQ